MPAFGSPTSATFAGSPGSVMPCFLSSAAAAAAWASGSLELGRSIISLGSYRCLIGWPIGFWPSLSSAVGMFDRALPGFFKPSICHVNGANWFVGSDQLCLRDAR